VASGGGGGVTHVRIGNYGGLQWMSKLELGIVGKRSKQVLYRITILSGLRFCIHFDLNSVIFNVCEGGVARF